MKDRSGPASGTAVEGDERRRSPWPAFTVCLVAAFIRSVFFVNVPIGLVAIVLALRLLPRPVGDRRRESLDPVGVLLLGVGVLLVLLPLVEQGSTGSFNPGGPAPSPGSSGGGMPWGLFPAAVVVLIGFVLWELWFARRGLDPMIDLTLFRRLSYAFGVAVGMVYFVVLALVIAVADVVHGRRLHAAAGR